MVHFVKKYFITLPYMIFDWLCISTSVIRGVWTLSKIPEPRVTFFGGARVTTESAYAKGARDLAQRLVEKGISIITGGGPGIMEAANCGARDATQESHELRSLGIVLKGLESEHVNKCSQKIITLKYLFARKYLLINYSVGFVVFPGGFGTIDELAEVLTLIQINGLKKVPVILFNCAYWEPFMEWVFNSAVHTGLLSLEDAQLITVTDDFEEVFYLLKQYCAPGKKA